MSGLGCIAEMRRVDASSSGMISHFFSLSEYEYVKLCRPVRIPRDELRHFIYSCSWNFVVRWLKKLETLTDQQARTFGATAKTFVETFLTIYFKMRDVYGYANDWRLKF